MSLTRRGLREEGGRGDCFWKGKGTAGNKRGWGGGSLERLHLCNRRVGVESSLREQTSVLYLTALAAFLSSGSLLQGSRDLHLMEIILIVSYYIVPPLRSRLTQAKGIQMGSEQIIAIMKRRESPFDWFLERIEPIRGWSSRGLAQHSEQPSWWSYVIRTISIQPPHE